MVSADVKYMSRGPGEASSLAGGEESLGPPVSQRRGIGVPHCSLGTGGNLGSSLGLCWCECKWDHRFFWGIWLGYKLLLSASFYFTSLLLSWSVD